MDLYLEVAPNPNCEPLEGLLYHPLEPARRVRRIRIGPEGQARWHWVTGVEPPPAPEGSPRWVPAQVQKVTDSGAGVAYCIYGGGWGLRFQPAATAAPRWDLADAAQWGEPYKLYGALDDLDLQG